MPSKNKFVPRIRFPKFYENWEAKRIDEVTERISEAVDVDSETLYQQIGIRSHGKGIFYKEFVTGKALGGKRVFWVKEEMFIVNIVFAWEHAIAKTTKSELGMIASHRFPMYKPIKGLLDIDYLLRFFLTDKGKYLLGLASPGGAGRNKTLGQQTFNALKLRLPRIEEQQKIASFLSAIDEKIQLLTRKKVLLEQYKKGVMQQLFSRKLRFKDVNGKAYPKWEVKKLGQIGNTFNGLTGKTKDDFGEGKPYVQYKQIFDSSKIDVNKCGYVRISKGEKQQRVRFGDVLFTTSSETTNEIGASSVLLEKVDEMYLNSFCFGFRPNSLTELIPMFAQYLFRNDLFRKDIIKLAQGSTRYNMSKVGLMKLKIFLPSKDEQQKIANFLSVLDTKIESVNYQITQTQLFKKGLLQQMFV